MTGVVRWSMSMSFSILHLRDYFHLNSRCAFSSLNVYIVPTANSWFALLFIVQRHYSTLLNPWIPGSVIPPYFADATFPIWCIALWSLNNYIKSFFYLWEFSMVPYVFSRSYIHNLYAIHICLNFNDHVFFKIRFKKNSVNDVGCMS